MAKRGWAGPGVARQGTWLVVGVEGPWWAMVWEIAMSDVDDETYLVWLGASEEHAEKIAARTGLGWSDPVSDALAGAEVLGEEEPAPLEWGPSGVETGPLRDVKTLDTLIAESTALLDSDVEVTCDPAASITDQEFDSVLSAVVMRECADLPPIQSHLVMRGGITEAAKQLAAIVAELQPCRPADVWKRIGNGLGEQEWGRFLTEAIEVGIVSRTTDGQLVSRRM